MPAPHHLFIWQGRCRTASPGKLGAFEEELYSKEDMADTPVVMAVYLQYVEGARTVGVAYCDATGRKLGACQFTDDEHFCNLETVLVQLGAKEAVLPKVTHLSLLSVYTMMAPPSVNLFCVENTDLSVEVWPRPALFHWTTL